MQWIEARIKLIMIVSGVITSTMIVAAIAPVASLPIMFGAALEGPAADVIVRNWGLLVALVGFMLIYGAFRPETRSLVLTVAIISKLAFVALLIVNGFAVQNGFAIGTDALFILLFAAYLMRQRNPAHVAD